MKKIVTRWTIGRLWKYWNLIEFAEYQREPAVWNLEKKKRLIDSIVRDFDIASIYLFRKEFIRKEDDIDVYAYDCIDGRQRINAILSYLGENKKDTHDNGFPLVMVNEIFEEDLSQYKEVNNRGFGELPPSWKDKITNYELNVIEIDKVDNPGELNLLFLRLNLGQILNAGERLHAMTGNMRDYVFKDIGLHPFFSGLDITYRRYAKEQVAAQIALNYFSRKKTGEFCRSRYLDLQEFFKEYSRSGEEDKKLTMEIKGILDKICSYFGGMLGFVRNRATAVSLFFFTSYLIDEGREDDIGEFAKFLIKLTSTLKWQIPKGVQMDSAYHYLLDFQTYVTQAAGEKYAIQNRHDFLSRGFNYYKKNGSIEGDDRYLEHTGNKADQERETVKL